MMPLARRGADAGSDPAAMTTSAAIPSCRPRRGGWRRIRRGRDSRRRAEQHDRRRCQPGRPQPATQAREPAEQGECPDPGKASVRAVGVSRPLPFEADGGAAERGDQHPEEINVRHPWHDGIERHVECHVPAARLAEASRQTPAGPTGRQMTRLERSSSRR